MSFLHDLSSDCAAVRIPPILPAASLLSASSFQWCLASPCAFLPPSHLPRKSFNPPFVGPISGTRTELVETEEKDGLVDLEAKDGGLDEAQRLAVDLDEALALLAVCDSSGGLLLAEALDGLNGRHFCGVVTRGVSKGRFGRGGRRWAGRR